MACSSNQKKLALWQGRFRRYLDSGLVVARFCAVEHLSESSFYYWQKKLRPQTLQRSARREDHGTRVEDRSTCATDYGAGTEGRGACPEDRNVFQPVTVVPVTCGVVIQLPGGARIEVDADHLDAIRVVVAETVRVDQDHAVERSVSPGNKITRKASPDNQVIRKASSGNPIIRQHGGAASC